MNKLELLSIAFGLAMDAFAVSITAGLKCKKVRFLYALKLALFFGVFQMIMPMIGWLAGVGFSTKIMSVDKYIAFVLLAFIGGKMIIETYRESKEGNNVDNKAYEYTIKIIIGLAVATSIDALAVGITFVCTGISSMNAIFINSSIIGAVTLGLCLCAVYIGNKFGEKFTNKAGYFGGAILILIGIKMLIEKISTFI